MNKKEFLARFDEMVEQGAEKMLEEYKQGKTIKEILEKPLIKCFRKIIFVDFNTIILLTFIDNIKKNPDLYKRFNSEIKNTKKLCNSIEKCENYIYSLFVELEKLNFKKL